jgi:1-acyl-sn-glycerol-3-phosphate acyltransferase
MAKAELTQIPFFRIFFKKMDIPVDRGSTVSSHKAYLRAGQDLDKGISILMYPEATIPDHTPKLKQFKAGPFKLAIEKQVPIVPVTFLTNWKLLPDGRRMKRGGRPGVSRVIVHKTIETTGMTEADEGSLLEKVYTTINTALQNYADQRRNSI